MIREKNKKDEKPLTKRHEEGERGESTHAGDNIGNFKAVQMAECIAEINYWESKAKAGGDPSCERELQEQHLQAAWHQPFHVVETDDRHTYLLFFRLILLRGTLFVESFHIVLPRAFPCT